MNHVHEAPFADIALARMGGLWHYRVMIGENDFVTSGAGFPAGEVALGRPSNDDFPEVSFEEAVSRIRYWKFMPPEEVRALTFHQHAWRREYLRRIAELERRLRTVF